MSKSPAGDIKLELFGDGESFDPDKGSYTSTGYVLIFGGWSNSLSVICRQDEHDDGRKAQRGDIRVEPEPQLPLHDHAARRRARLERSTAARSCPGPIPSRWPEPATNTWPSTTGRPSSRSTTSRSDPRPERSTMDEPPSPPFDLEQRAGRPGGAHVAAHLHARQSGSGRARGGAGAAAPRASTSWASMATLTYGGIVGRAQNRAMVENLKMPLTPVERIDLDAVRHHRAGRQPAGDRQQLAAATSHRIDIVIDHHPLRPGQRARRVVRHPPGPRRDLDDRVRVPAPAAPSRSMRRWRRRSSSRCAPRRAISDANRPRPSGARTSRWCRSSITTCSIA